MGGGGDFDADYAEDDEGRFWLVSREALSTPSSDMLKYSEKKSLSLCPPKVI